MSLVPREDVLHALVEWGYAYNREQPFRLASGEVNPEYVDCRTALTRPWLLDAVAGHLLGEVRVKAFGIGGLTMGADPLAIAISLKHCQTTHDGSEPMGWFSIRKVAKQHGAGGVVVTALRPGDPVIVVDDVVTTGSSTIQAIRACRDAGLLVRQVIALLDRQAGGLQAIQAALDEDPTSVVAQAYAFFTLSELRAEWQEQNPAHSRSG